MAESKEYSTIVKCSRDLEIVLEESNKDIAKFLFQQGLISKERHDEVINPKSLLTGADKASMLVTTIRNRVELNPRNYHKVVDYMRQNIIFRDVVAILDAEYQGSTPPEQHPKEKHPQGLAAAGGSRTTPDFSEVQKKIGDRPKLPPLSCFDWEAKSLELNKGAALNPTDDKLWLPGSVLKVYFMGDVPPVRYDGDCIIRDKIIGWMNEWSGNKSPRFVPKFEITTEIEKSDVRVDFIEKSGSHSYLGRDAKKHKGQATMNLDLKENGPNHAKPQNYKKYLVLHETGHALGFDHEHQHPAFDEEIFDEVVVKQDLMFSFGISSAEAKHYYRTNFSINPQSSQTFCPRDKDSIMKYSAPKRWIKTKFWEYFYNDDNMDEKGYSWPMSALNGELTSSDKEYADKVYKELHERQQTGGSSHGSTPGTSSHGSIPPAGNRIEADSSKEIATTQELTIKDMDEICEFLKNLLDKDARKLGLALGLLFPTLQRMTNLPDDMIHAWLSGQSEKDNRTWGDLIAALKRNGQFGIAKEIEKSRKKK